jgi:hypothetical protein
MADSKEASWIKHYWRPAMAYQYLVVCIFDFIIFPLATIIFFTQSGQDYAQWEPITLAQSGFYHLSMAAIIGVAAWTRGQEKIRNLWTGEETTTTTTTQTPTTRD